MDETPDNLKNIDLERTNDIVRRELKRNYLEHPKRGPYVKSSDLYEELADEIDDRFTPGQFGMFYESRTYLEKRTRGYKGSYRYRIIQESFDQ